MQAIVHIGLVSESSAIALSEVTRVSAALQKQLMRDVTPHWNLQGTVDAFTSLSDVPPGYWPIIIRDDIGQDASGVHCDDNGQPMALIVSDVDWSVTASHEMIEMLVDPFGNTMIASTSVAPTQGRVEYLIEACDPVSGLGYQVNGVNVSDFYTRRFFDPVKVDGAQYSYMGTLTAPRQTTRGGYLTWFEPVAGEWWQQSWFTGDQPTIRSLGPVQKTTCGLRPTIDRLTHRYRRQFISKTSRDASPAKQEAAKAAAASGTAKARMWHAHIDKLAAATTE